MIYDKVDFEFEQILVTPEIAKEMLKNTSNPLNRDIKFTGYVEDIDSGKWDTASEGVFLFYYNGVLKNGHHRLMAISKSHSSMWMTIVRPSKDPTIFDNGKLRTAKDHMVMMGYGKELCKQKTISVGTFLLNSVVPGRRRTKLEVIDYVVNHPELNTARIICDSARQGEDCITRNNYISAAIYCALRCGVNEDTIREFVKVTNSGFITSEKQTAAQYFKKSVKALAHEKERSRGGEMYSKKVFRIVQEALRDYSNGVNVKRLYKGEYNGYANKLLEMDFMEKKDNIPETESLQRDRRNKEYLERLDGSREQIAAGEVVVKSLDELTKNNTVSDAKKSIEKKQKSMVKKFVPPTVEEVKEYIKSIKSTVDPYVFHDYYASNGWRVGKNPMKDWKAAVRYWERKKYA